MAKVFKEITVSWWGDVYGECWVVVHPPYFVRLLPRLTVPTLKPYLLPTYLWQFREILVEHVLRQKDVPRAEVSHVPVRQVALHMYAYGAKRSWRGLGHTIYGWPYK